MSSISFDNLECICALPPNECVCGLAIPEPVPLELMPDGARRYFTLLAEKAKQRPISTTTGKGGIRTGLLPHVRKLAANGGVKNKGSSACGLEVGDSCVEVAENVGDSETTAMAFSLPPEMQGATSSSCNAIGEPDHPNDESTGRAAIEQKERRRSKSAWHEHLESSLFQSEGLPPPDLQAHDQFARPRAMHLASCSIRRMHMHPFSSHT